LITGVGIDIVQIRRMERWRRQPGLLKRYFHPHELAAVFEKKRDELDHSLAARFAAKEAFGKALGGFAGRVLKDIMVVSRPDGRPELRVEGATVEALKKNGANRIHLSLAHERDNAVAMVVLEVV